MDAREKLLNEKIAVRLRAARMARGWSQTHLGEKLNLSFQQIQKYENATNAISAAKLKCMAEALDIAVDYFYDIPGGTKENPPLRRVLAIMQDLDHIERQSPDALRPIAKLVAILADRFEKD